MVIIIRAMGRRIKDRVDIVLVVDMDRNEVPVV
jgi:hypothetical protein